MTHSSPGVYSRVSYSSLSALRPMAFDARELGGRYHALHKFVPCRSRYLPN